MYVVGLLLFGSSVIRKLFILGYEKVQGFDLQHLNYKLLITCICTYVYKKKLRYIHKFTEKNSVAT